MKDIRRMCEHFLKTPWRFLLWKDVIEWISNEKLHLCEQGLRNCLECLKKPYNIMHMRIFSPKHQSDDIFRCLYSLFDLFTSILLFWETNFLY